MNELVLILKLKFFILLKVDVVIDDRLPFWSSGRLAFACNQEQPNEYWVNISKSINNC